MVDSPKLIGENSYLSPNSGQKVFNTANFDLLLNHESFFVYYEKTKLFQIWCAYLQFWKMNMVPLVIMPYENGVTLREENLCKKSFQSSESEVYFKTGSDLSKEVLWVSLG